MLFDTHVHLNARQFKNDRDEVIERAKNAGVTNMVVVGFNDETIPLELEIAESHDHIYASVGRQLGETIYYKEDHYDKLKKYSEHEKVVAIGEMGLDYH